MWGPSTTLPLINGTWSPAPRGIKGMTDQEQDRRVITLTPEAELARQQEHEALVDAAVGEAWA